MAPRQKVRHWLGESLTREVGQFELTGDGLQAAIDSAMHYHEIAERRRTEPRDDLLTRLIAAELTGAATEKARREC